MREGSTRWPAKWRRACGLPAALRAGIEDAEDFTLNLSNASPGCTLDVATTTVIITAQE
jgi:hypothetical protein